MTARVSDYKEVLYTREYSNDVPPQSDLLKRIGLAVVPFLSLSSVLRLPVSLGMGSLRIWNSATTPDNTLQTAIAVTSLVGTIFQHRVGMLATTGQDLFLEIQKLVGHDNWEDAATSLVKILNDLTYLALIAVGGLELSIIAFALQTVINLLQSKDELKKGRWIEGCANLLMAGVRLHQTHIQYKQLKRNWEIEKAIKQFYVGELHEKWRFPSDHLPVGIEVDGVRVISWNVLNNAYMEWVTDKDSQGLNGSLISELNVVVQEDGLTLRDILVADMVQNMMSKGQIVALQECGAPFLKHLEARLPQHWELVKSFAYDCEDQDVVLYDKTQLAYCPGKSETTTSAYPSVPNRPIQSAYFTHQNGRDLSIINAHIPGDPNKPGREEFAKYTYERHREAAITVALGDNNFEREEMIAAYRKAGFTDFSIHSPWQTNIDPYTKKSKGIDHLFVIGDDNSRDLSVDEVLSNGNLQETIDLLNQN